MTRDRILSFGPQDRLSGVLSGQPHPDGEVLVLLNAGTMPRVGPFRLYVDLARHLAARGRAVFRLDLPGVGEAPVLSDAGELEVLSGLLLLDPVAFRGPWFWFERWREFLSRSPLRWGQVLRRRLRPAATAVAAPAAGDFRDWPTREEAHAHVTHLLARGARMLVVFTGSARERFVHPRQMSHSFGPAAQGGGVELHFFPGSDHLFYLRCYRQRLTAAIERWLAPG